jgi:predicted MFS family arabinose efflux permease
MSDASFAAVLRVREFRWLWFADVQSLFGDQLARVALSVLVFQDTGSGLLTAGVYALTYLPALLGSLLLGWLADRLPRRRLLVLGDLCRAVVIAAMAIPQVPVGAVAGLLVIAVVIGTPWKAAESALVTEILAGEGYVLGSGLRAATLQAAQLLGFAVGGAIVAAIGSRGAFAVDAGTFAVSAVLIGLAIHPRPASGVGRQRGWRAGVAAVAGSAQLRVLLGLSWLAGLFVVPEGLAAPYAAALHGGAKTTGLLLAAGPFGAMLGLVGYVRLVPQVARMRSVGLLAIVCGLPLIVCSLKPGLVITMVLWALCGACSAYQVQVFAEFARAVPNESRGQAIAVASAGLLAVQGVGLVLGGAVAQLSTIFVAVAGAGALGMVLAVPLAGTRARHQRAERGEHVTRTAPRQRTAGAHRR